MNNDRQRPQIKKHVIITDKEWSVRHLYDGEGWIESYWRSRNDPHRLFLAEKICKFSSNSVLEIGCACGPNLYQIARRCPKSEIRGIDINPLAIRKGNEWFMHEGISNVKLEVGRVQELEHFADKSFDVVFTDAVLIYISPDEIKQVVKEMLRIGRVVVMNEWHTFNKSLALFLSIYNYLKQKSKEWLFPREPSRTLNYSFKPRSISLDIFVGHWVRDYRALLEEFVSKEKIYVTKLPKELWNDRGWRRWGAIIEVVR